MLFLFIIILLSSILIFNIYSILLIKHTILNFIIFNHIIIFYFLFSVFTYIFYYFIKIKKNYIYNMTGKYSVFYTFIILLMLSSGIIIYYWNYLLFFNIFVLSYKSISIYFFKNIIYLLVYNIWNYKNFFMYLI